MINKFNYLMWIIICIIILIVSIYFTIKTKFTQLNIIKMIKSLIRSNEDSNISNLETLMITLGGKIGVGSISGIALAIYYGGPGTIFWIIIISIIISILTYYEVYLGGYFKEIDQDNINKGGPPYYIEKGLKNKKLSIIYTLLIVCCYNGCFLSIQSNTISRITTHFFYINPLLIGLIISITTLSIIYKGIKKIAKISNILVPIMLIIYVSLASYILFINITNIPNIIKFILQDAFKLKSIISGFIPMIIISIQRTIFATESGIGTTSIVASTSNNSPKNLAYIQLIGVHITTFVICISTAIIILTTNYQLLNLEHINGIEIVIYAFNYHFGKMGNIFLYFIIILFSFSTIITGYYNGESCIKSLNRNISKYLKILTILILFLGVITNSTKLWNITDLLIGIILIINIYTMYKLKNIVKE